MRKIFTASALTTLIALGACGNNPEENIDVKQDVKQEAIVSCPTPNVLTDVSSYAPNITDTELDQAAWFEANGKKEGVVTTPSGLQYRVNKSGDSNGINPLATETVRVNYHGIFLDGSTFDSSYDRGKDIEFPLNRVIKGWTEGVALMKPCDAWTFYIPSDLAYGPNGRGSIPPATPLVFHVQLLEVIK